MACRYICVCVCVYQNIICTTTSNTFNCTNRGNFLCRMAKRQDDLIDIKTKTNVCRIVTAKSTTVASIQHGNLNSFLMLEWFCPTHVCVCVSVCVCVYVCMCVYTCCYSFLCSSKTVIVCFDT